MLALRNRKPGLRSHKLVRQRIRHTKERRSRKPVRLRSS
jgi:hypothetical protein